MLRACPHCREHHKPHESSCPHCGRASAWNHSVAGLAAAAMLGGACTPQDAGPNVPRPLYGMPPPEKPLPPPGPPSPPRPIYGIPPREKPPLAEPMPRPVPEKPGK